MRGITGLIFAGLLVLSGQSNPVEIATHPVEVVVSSFEIQGETIEELQQSLRERGPKDQFGEGRDAYTGWRISWNWPIIDGAPQWRDASITLRIDLVLPVWNPRLAPEPEALVAWGSFFPKLIMHEQEHIQAAVRARAALESRIKSLPNSTNALTVKALIDEALDSMHQFDRHFDEETNHGETQGVRLTRSGREH